MILYFQIIENYTMEKAKDDQTIVKQQKTDHENTAKNQQRRRSICVSSLLNIMDEGGWFFLNCKTKLDT